MTIELRRRGFLGALIGAALAPRLILSSMAEPTRLAVLQPVQALSLVESAIVLPAGGITSINLWGTAERSKAGTFALHRANGQCVIRLAFDVYGGLLLWGSATDQIVSTERHPLLIVSDADIEGSIEFDDLTTGLPHRAAVNDGQILRIQRASG